LDENDRNITLAVSTETMRESQSEVDQRRMGGQSTSDVTTGSKNVRATQPADMSIDDNVPRGDSEAMQIGISRENQSNIGIDNVTREEHTVTTGRHGEEVRETVEKGDNDLNRTGEAMKVSTETMGGYRREAVDQRKMGGQSTSDATTRSEIAGATQPPADMSVADNVPNNANEAMQTGISVENQNDAGIDSMTHQEHTDVDVDDEGDRNVR
jgi:hypothetical protein